MINNINHSNLSVEFPETPPSTKSPAICLYILRNYDQVRLGQTRQLCLSVPNKLDAADLRSQHIVRTILSGDMECVQLHEKIAALNFNEIVFLNGSQCRVTNREDLIVDALNDEEYTALINMNEEVSHQEADSDFNSFAKSLISKLFIQTLSSYSKFERKIIDYMRELREQEQQIVAEDTRLRRVKKRDQKWNMHMDHWLKKEANRWDLLQSMKRST